MEQVQEMPTTSQPARVNIRNVAKNGYFQQITKMMRNVPKEPDWEPHVEFFKKTTFFLAKGLDHNNRVLNNLQINEVQLEINEQDEAYQGLIQACIWEKQEEKDDEKSSESEEESDSDSTPSTLGELQLAEDDTASFRENLDRTLHQSDFLLEFKKTFVANLVEVKNEFNLKMKDERDKTVELQKELKKSIEENRKKINACNEQLVDVMADVKAMETNLEDVANKKVETNDELSEDEKSQEQETQYEQCQLTDVAMATTGKSYPLAFNCALREHLEQEIKMVDHDEAAEIWKTIKQTAGPEVVEFLRMFENFHEPRNLKIITGMYKKLLPPLVECYEKIIKYIREKYKKKIENS